MSEHCDQCSSEEPRPAIIACMGCDDPVCQEHLDPLALSNGVIYCRFCYETCNGCNYRVFVCQCAE